MVSYSIGTDFSAREFTFCEVLLTFFFHVHLRFWWSESYEYFENVHIHIRIFRNFRVPYNFEKFIFQSYEIFQPFKLQRFSDLCHILWLLKLWNPSYKEFFLQFSESKFLEVECIFYKIKTILEHFNLLLPTIHEQSGR
jgi:hypothetical protein